MTSELITQDVNFCRVQSINGLELIHAHYLNYTFPRHLHEEYVIAIVVQGAEEINHRGVTYTAPAGSLILINPSEPHSNRSINGCGFTYRTFYSSIESLKQINYDLTGKEDSPLFSTPVVKQSDMFQLLLCLHIKLGQADSALEQESEFISVMAQLIVRHSRTDVTIKRVASKHRYIRAAREYLEAFYAENFSLQQLASVAGISPFHLLRTFRNEIGLSPFEYQNQLRISRAKKLLRDGWSIADAATETGFVDQSHLTKHFKRVVGITPGRYLPDSNKIQSVSHKKI